MNSAPLEVPTDGWRSTFRTLRYRNYRLFFGGQGLSLIGTWMTRIATSWLIYRLARGTPGLDAEWMLGLIAFAGQIPILLFSPLAGVWVDRLNRHTILVFTQILSTIQSLALAFLALSGLVQIWHVMALAVFQGLINALDTPARQAFVVEMIEDRRDLPNAIALNSSMFNGARLLGPAIGGLLIARFSEGACFLIDGISYLAVIAALLAMKLRARPIATVHQQVWHELKEGVAYTFRFTPIRAILVLIGVSALMGTPYMVLMPRFATAIVHGSWTSTPTAVSSADADPAAAQLDPREATTYGWLMAVAGLGALLAAVYLASRQSVRGLGRLIVAAAVTFSLSLMAFAFSLNLSLSLVLVFISGFAMMVHMAASNTIVQTIVDESKRGRVMGFYSMAVLGLQPLGSLFAGALASRIGAPATVALGGGVCLLAAVFFATRLEALRQQIRPIYLKMGIIPQVASGLQAATQLSPTPAE